MQISKWIFLGILLVAAPQISAYSDLAVDVNVIPQSPQPNETGMVIIQIANIGSEPSNTFSLYSHAAWEDRYMWFRANQWENELSLAQGEIRTYR